MFIDAQEQHKQSPETFDAPSIIELSTLKKGDTVKVCNGKERFWTIIKEITGDKIKAEVNNQLFDAKEYGYDCGDTISFEKRHIYDIFER